MNVRFDDRDRLSQGIPPAWASAWGEDEFGAFACFEVAGVEQRMRWIEPGKFRMGSPKGEVGRFDQEGPQHLVTLTEGFWLADTLCTQQLWGAVMGECPSRFRSSRRPVECVSWKDVVEGFLPKLNVAVPGLEAGLPKEAQWEYACRAGTATATYAGNTRDAQGMRNDKLLNDIAWYANNTSMGTMHVGLKTPNPWGLYDMLGNVYEWCADAQRRYTSNPVSDPVGTIGSGRVLRGGSWGSYAEVCRAAYRNEDNPSHRSGHLGFRLAQGLILRPAQPTR